MLKACRSVQNLLKKTTSSATQQMINSHQKMADVTIINLYENKNYDDIIDKIAGSDKVITC